MRAALITAALVLATATSGCATAPGVIHGRTVQLHQETSAAGESLDAFVVRIAPQALAASKTARATVCGEVIEQAGGYALQLKTDGYVSECALPPGRSTYVLVNGTATDIRENHPSLENRGRPGYLVTPWSVTYQDGITLRPRVVQ